MPRTMARKIDEIVLNPEQVRSVLEGFDYDHYFNSINVEYIRVARRLGHNFPRVDVTRVNDVYQLVFGPDFYSQQENYGGHSRSVLALQEDLSLECNLYNGHRKNPFSTTWWDGKPITFIPIARFKPNPCPIDVSTSAHLLKNINRLPPKVKLEFMKKHSLVIYNGILMTQDNFDNPPPF